MSVYVEKTGECEYRDTLEYTDSDNDCQHSTVHKNNFNRVVES